MFDEGKDLKIFLENKEILKIDMQQKNRVTFKRIWIKPSY